ncbi:hypothetical protein HYW94_01470 [Candidatus Uhrbacteria bacterium]|nr:hypothetical protein [Candidatus Uhrbacteria bacterium]
MAATKSTPSTQKYVKIREITNDTVILKDGTLCAVILVASVNFFLKSEDEQQATILGYQNFLNTIDFPLQIVVQSRIFDITKYLTRLEKIEKEQTNDLLKMQMAEYRKYVSELVQIGQIMDKKFFIAVPYNPMADVRKGFIQQAKTIFSASGDVVLSRERFFQRKHFLDLRVETVMSGLRSLGLNSAKLDTQSLIELFYSIYNFETAPQEKMVETNKLQIEEY